jgi:dTDP-4-dehydrorhamnose reductase
VLGADGMLGRSVMSVLSESHDTFGTVRTIDHTVPGSPRKNIIDGIDIRDDTMLSNTLEELQPAAVVNCVGIVKQRTVSPEEAIVVNALFPHRLARNCQKIGAYCIHISTDCVFSGKRGYYSESDEPDPVDAYGRTKLLGEPGRDALTLRSSLIGLETKRHHGLVEWFLRQSGCVNGYTNALFSGVPCEDMAGIIQLVLERKERLFGVWHVAAEPISKFDLLSGLAEHMSRDDLTIVENDQVHCNRVLDGRRFGVATGWKARPWSEMIASLSDCIKNRSSVAGIA